MMRIHRKSQNGFTIIELLIVVLIIGVLAAIAIPNLLTGMQRAKQKRTMSDMRSIATAWEARSTDFGRYNAAGYSPLSSIIGQAQLEQLVSPTYIRDLPNKDGWGNGWAFSMDQAPAAATAAGRYQIISYGRNGTFDPGSAGATTQFDCDLVYENGAFVVYPDGVQASQ